MLVILKNLNFLNNHTFLEWEGQATDDLTSVLWSASATLSGN